MKLVFVLAEWFPKMLGINLFQVMQIIWAFRIYAFVDAEKLTAFLLLQGVTAMRTAQNMCCGEFVIDGVEDS